MLDKFPIKPKPTNEMSSKGKIYTVVPMTMGNAIKEVDIRDSPYGVLQSVQEFALNPPYTGFSGNNLLY